MARRRWWTAFEIAVREGHEEVVGELLSARADVNTHNEGVMDVLLAAGANLGEDRTDSLPLHAAAKDRLLQAIDEDSPSRSQRRPGRLKR